MEVICDHAGVEGCARWCPHRKRHKLDDTLFCDEEECREIQKVVKCIPVEAKKDHADLLVRLKDQIQEINGYNGRMSQILIMEALAALLEAR